MVVHQMKGKKMTYTENSRYAVQINTENGPEWHGFHYMNDVKDCINSTNHDFKVYDQQFREINVTRAIEHTDRSAMTRNTVRSNELSPIVTGFLGLVIVLTLVGLYESLPVVEELCSAFIKLIESL